MRPASTALDLLLGNVNAPLFSGDLFTLTLQDGSTVYRWTSWVKDLLNNDDGFTYISQRPWLTRSKWNVTNTMEVSTLDVNLLALNDGFAGGADIKAQIHNGLMDGATMLLQRAFMPTPDDTTTLGTIVLFGGIVSTIEPLTGNSAKIKVKGKNNKLAMNAPRNVYQVGCLHAFCDAGCTLSRGSFTTAYTVGAGPTRTFLPWNGAAPGNAANYRFGSVQITSGPASGQWRTVRAADSSGLTLVYPLYDLPVIGDGFNAFEGCDKTLNSGSGQSCTDRSNQQNFRAFPFVPPAETGF
jgi:hypothetical protein